MENYGYNQETYDKIADQFYKKMNKNGNYPRPLNVDFQNFMDANYKDIAITSDLRETVYHRFYDEKPMESEGDKDYDPDVEAKVVAKKITAAPFEQPKINTSIIDDDFEYSVNDKIFKKYEEAQEYAENKKAYSFPKTFENYDLSDLKYERTLLQIAFNDELISEEEYEKNIKILNKAIDRKKSRNKNEKAPWFLRRTAATIKYDKIKNVKDQINEIISDLNNELDKLKEQRNNPDVDEYGDLTEKGNAIIDDYEKIEDAIDDLKECQKRINKIKLFGDNVVSAKKINAEEKTEGSGELAEEDEDLIIEFVSTTPNLDDEDFHAFCEEIGVDKHEAEEVIYRAFYELMQVLNEENNESEEDVLSENKVEAARVTSKTFTWVVDEKELIKNLEEWIKLKNIEMPVLVTYKGKTNNFKSINDFMELDIPIGSNVLLSYNVTQAPYNFGEVREIIVTKKNK